MSKPTTPNKERRELIDKGYIEPDPSRDLMSHAEWREHDKFLTKVQQSWMRTMDDFRERTAKLEDRARDPDQRDR